MSTPVMHELTVSELPCSHVTVYTDRAEVKRLVKAQLKAGANEVLLRGLARAADADSVRVDGRGVATISEVLVRQKVVVAAAARTDREALLAAQLNQLEKDKERVDIEMILVEKRVEILNRVADSTAGGADSDRKKEAASPTVRDFTSEAAMGDLDKFLGFYEDRAMTLTTRVADLHCRSTTLGEQVTATRRNLKDLRAKAENDALSREVSIVLEAAVAGAVELELTYVVSDAGWSPSYDVRVNTSAEAKSMQVLYYGQIWQKSGEDWTETRVSLSTATPAVGGCVPELHTLRVGIAPKPQPERKPVKMKKRPASMEEDEDEPNYQSLPGDEVFGKEMLDEVAPVIEKAVTQAREGVLSTAFEIARPTTVRADGATQRVGVAVVELTPTLEHETVPSRSPTAFVKAVAVNTSGHPFLAGPVAVFLDNNFVAKSALKAVSPGEAFSVGLGADAAVRVDYRPASEFNQQSGFLSKSAVVTHSQRVHLNNTRIDQCVTVRLLHQIPLSTDHKIKVNLLKPELGKEARLSKDKLLEWTVRVAGGETKELEIKYTVEYPAGEKISMVEDA